MLSAYQQSAKELQPLTCIPTTILSALLELL